MSWTKLWSRRKAEPETPLIDPAAAYTEGMEAWERGELDLAEQRLVEAAEAAPEELKHVGNLGNLYHQRGKLADALRRAHAAVGAGSARPVGTYVRLRVGGVPESAARALAAAAGPPIVHATPPVYENSMKSPFE